MSKKTKVYPLFIELTSKSGYLKIFKSLVELTKDQKDVEKFKRITIASQKERHTLSKY